MMRMMRLLSKMIIFADIYRPVTASSPPRHRLVTASSPLGFQMSDALNRRCEMGRGDGKQIDAVLKAESSLLLRAEKPLNIM